MTFTDRDWAREGHQMSKMREPDFTGPMGKAWKLKMPSIETLKDPNWRAMLSGWVMTIPSAHPAWHSYMLCLIHLRGLPGVKPAFKEVPENTHEFSIYALNPQHDLPNPETVMEDGNVHTLTPVNLVHQFGHLNDEQAIDLIEQLVRAYTDGYASPDTDYNFHTRRMVRNTIEHIVLGGHAKAKA